MESSEKNSCPKDGRKIRRQAYIILACGLFVFLLSCVFAGLNIADMRRYETQFVRVGATVTGMRTDHVGGGDPKRIYRLVFTYELDGREYEGTDTISRWEAYKAADGRLLGTQVELYVNPNAPNEVCKVSSADLFSVISVSLFAFSAILSATGLIFTLHLYGKNSLKNRTVFVWLPLFAVCAAVVLLFWLGLPCEGFGAVFVRVRGAVGYTVLGGIALICVFADWLKGRKRRKNG